MIEVSRAAQMAKPIIGQKIVMQKPPLAKTLSGIGPASMGEVMAAAKRGPPPVHLWNPPFCGDIDMRIARDGTWFYEGTPIGRPALVRLFSQILRREGDDYFLVTPVEKVGITVEDAPFLAVDFDVEGAGAAQNLRFYTKTEDEVVASAQNPIRLARSADGQPAPYVHIRAGLEALIDRKSFYRMVDLAQTAPHMGQDWLGVYSGGMFFALIAIAELDAALSAAGGA
jgi:hypothetical protein